MPISWNEIRQNAIAFSREWADVSREAAEKQTFWNEFFQVFGMRRRAVASFEEPVKQISGRYGHIDLFWKGKLLVEHKSRGQDLGKAESQAFDYIQDLAREHRDDDIPQYVIVSDFARVSLHDLEPEEQKPLPLFAGHRVDSIEFPLTELHQNIHAFAFIAGYQQHRFQDHDPTNLEAVKIMDDLHDALKAGGYRGHELERFMVRVLFCLFAEDTGIFDRESFRLYVEDRTRPDGSDLGLHLARLFAVLNTPRDGRQANLDETLNTFPYVNGDLFDETLGFADFNKDMRNRLLACTKFDWSKISPAIFGSLFQGVMESKERRQTGGHYTSERDILKVVRSLFLDDLCREFEEIKTNKARLRQFHQKISRLRFLDPACGCGNFLVIAYRELRLLEIEILKILGVSQPHLAELDTLSLLGVDAFCGIEISEWPARIAEVAMWLMDHQMNTALSEMFGQYLVRLPLTKSPKIVCGNALRLDWKDVLPPDKCSYVLGNPPFVGKHLMTKGQSEDMELVWGKAAGSGFLDYVTGWYLKAARYIDEKRIVVGFVSTNSVTQGEQVGILWSALFRSYGVKIHFAHRTFPWESEARGKAHVHVVIIGFAGFDAAKKLIYDYEAEGNQVNVTRAGNISPYLIEGSDIVLPIRRKALCAVPPIINGNKPADGGHLIIEDSEKAPFLKENPKAAPYLRRFLCAEEYLKGDNRWVLWLEDAPAAVVRENPGVRDRVAAVRAFRLKSKKESTRRRADRPTLFDQIRQPRTKYIVIPRHSSESRRYVPFGYFGPEVIIGDSCTAIPDASLFHFGVLSSAMHMAWMRQVCGRLKSDFRYSNKIVYNNFPWPESATEKQTKAVEAAARRVLDVRDEHLSKGARLVDLYDPLAIPAKLSKAHNALDRSVERCYRPQAFVSDRERVEFLFELYAKIAKPLLPAKQKRRQKNAPPEE
jgi:hypothetical protein